MRKNSANLANLADIDSEISLRQDELLALQRNYTLCDNDRERGLCRINRSLIRLRIDRMEYLTPTLFPLGAMKGGQ